MISSKWINILSIAVMITSIAIVTQYSSIQVGLAMCFFVWASDLRGRNK